jgi:hypothetical protein
MAGKTLSGIGDDESGRHEIGKDAPASASPSVNKPPSARPTDRMPMYIGNSGTPTIGPGTMPAPASGAANVDDDKVAEGLKKLRSLDEPLGPIPAPSAMPTLRDKPAPLTLPKPANPTGGTPTLKETPIVGLPTPVNPAAVAAAAAAELIRSRGTAHGHALSVPVAGQASLPVAGDDRMKGTLLGHDLHLPDLPALSSDDARSAGVRSIAPAHEPGALVRGSNALEAAHDSHFSQGDSTFFDSETEDEEFALENPRGKMIIRGAIFLAVVSVFVVAALAWGRYHKADAPAEAQAPPSPPPAPTEPQAAAPAPAPTEAQPAAAPTAAAPAPAAAPTAPALTAPAPTAQAPSAAPPPAPPPVAAVPEEEVKPAAVEAPPAAHQKPKRPSVAARPVAAAPHASKPAAPPHEQPKAPATGKKAKDEDPDGTLPLTE